MSNVTKQFLMKHFHDWLETCLDHLQINAKQNIRKNMSYIRDFLFCYDLYPDPSFWNGYIKVTLRQKMSILSVTLPHRGTLYKQANPINYKRSV